MRVQQPKQRLCGVCQETMTTSTAHVELKKKTISFPCCVRCRGKVWRLQRQESMMAEEEVLLEQHRAASLRQISLTPLKAEKADDLVEYGPLQPSFTMKKKMNSMIKQHGAQYLLEAIETAS